MILELRLACNLHVKVGVFFSDVDKYVDGA